VGGFWFLCGAMFEVKPPCPGRASGPLEWQAIGSPRSGDLGAWPVAKRIRFHVKPKAIF
jgi:hypothetical protein